MVLASVTGNEQIFKETKIPVLLPEDQNGRSEDPYIVGRLRKEMSLEKSLCNSGSILSHTCINQIPQGIGKNMDKIWLVDCYLDFSWPLKAYNKQRFKGQGKGFLNWYNVKNTFHRKLVSSKCAHSLLKQKHQHRILNTLIIIIRHVLYKTQGN